MAGDTVLPPTGGWVMIRRRLPAGLPQVPLFSLFWAMPEAVFVEGAFDIRRWPQPTLRSNELWQVYKARHTKQRMATSERETAERVEREYEDSIGRPLELEMRVKIRAPGGDCCVEPYEWTLVRDIAPYMAAIGTETIMHEYGDAPRGKGFKDRLFYLQSRGISKVDAIQMLFGEIRGPNTLWLEIVPEVARLFDREAA